MAIKTAFWVHWTIIRIFWIVGGDTRSGGFKSTFILGLLGTHFTTKDFEELGKGSMDLNCNSVSHAQW